MLAAGVHAVLGSGEHLVHVHHREHGEGSEQRAGLDGDAAPQQRGVARLVQQRADRHLQVGEESGEEDPGDDLQETPQLDRCPSPLQSKPDVERLRGKPWR